MKSILLISLMILSASISQAHVAKLICGDAGKTVELILGDVPYLNADSTSLKINGSGRTVQKIKAQINSVGMNAIVIEAGTGSRSSHYFFQNLAAQKCLNPNTIQQNGQAIVKVINASGVIFSAACVCAAL